MSPSFALYRRLPGIVLAFHGCDEKVGEDLLCGRGPRHLVSSNNAYDWLGSGVYFWENDPQRAQEFAQAAVANPQLTRGKVKKPFVVGAVIDLGLCLNLLDRTCLAEVEEAHGFLAATNELAEIAVRNTACIKGYFRPISA